MTKKSIKEMAAFVAALTVIPVGVMAEEDAATYPRRSISLVVGTPPGGANDILSRKIAGHMSELLGQKIIVEYRPGASANLGAMSVASADPDGYTIYMSTRSAALHKTMYPHLQYDYARDLTPIGMVARMPVSILVGKHVGATTFDGLIQLLKANPGRSACGTLSIGSTLHVLSEMFQELAEVKMQHIPYLNAHAALADLVGGRIDLLFIPLSVALPFIQSDSVRELAVTSDKRAVSVPDVPTVSELGYAAMSEDDWFALMAPARTPPAIIAKLNHALKETIARQDVQEALGKMGYVLPTGDDSPQAVRENILQDADRWTELLADHGIRGFQ